MTPEKDFLARPGQEEGGHGQLAGRRDGSRVRPLPGLEGQDKEEWPEGRQDLLRGDDRLALRGDKDSASQDDARDKAGPREPGRISLQPPRFVHGRLVRQGPTPISSFLGRKATGSRRRGLIERMPTCCPDSTLASPDPSREPSFAGGRGGVQRPEGGGKSLPRGARPRARPAGEVVLEPRAYGYLPVWPSGISSAFNDGCDGEARRQLADLCSRFRAAVGGRQVFQADEAVLRGRTPGTAPLDVHFLNLAWIPASGDCLIGSPMALHFFSQSGRPKKLGMGRSLYEHSLGARALYEEAGRVLGWDIAKVSFEAPKRS